MNLSTVSLADVRSHTSRWWRQR